MHLENEVRIAAEKLTVLILGVANRMQFFNTPNFDARLLTRACKICHGFSMTETEVVPLGPR